MVAFCESDAWHIPGGLLYTIGKWVLNKFYEIEKDFGSLNETNNSTTKSAENFIGAMLIHFNTLLFQIKVMKMRWYACLIFLFKTQTFFLCSLWLSVTYFRREIIIFAIVCTLYTPRGGDFKLSGFQIYSGIHSHKLRWWWRWW